MRCIIRISFDGDDGRSTNQVRGLLENSGFVRIGTGSFDANDIPELDALETLQALSDALEHRDGPGRLDHLWVYLDDPGF